MLGPNSICLWASCMRHTSFQEFVEAAAAGGFDAIALWPIQYESARAAGLSYNDMRLMLKDHGLVISELDALFGWVPGAENFQLSGLPKIYGEDVFFQIADSLGARTINAPCMLSYRPETEIVVKAFGALCDRAARHDLKVALEFIPWTGVPDIMSAVEIVQKANRPNGGILLDTWHLHRSSGGVREVLSVPGKTIIATQFNDASPVRGNDLAYEARHGRLFPGEGVIDLVGIIRALDSKGCTAPVGIEVISDEMNALSPIEGARRAGSSMRSILNKARNLKSKA